MRLPDSSLLLVPNDPAKASSATAVKVRLNWLPSLLMVIVPLAIESDWILEMGVETLKTPILARLSPATGPTVSAPVPVTIAEEAGVVTPVGRSNTSKPVSATELIVSVAAWRVTGTMGGLGFPRRPATVLVPVASTVPVPLVCVPRQLVERVVSTGTGPMELSRDVRRKTRRAWRLPRWVSDSTLYRLLAKQLSKGMRETVRAQVEQILAAEVATGIKSLLPIDVLTIDGKSVLTTSDAPVAGMEQTPCDAAGTPLWRLGGLRAVLTSSPSAPCIDIEFIGAKEGESPAFRVLFPRVVATFGHLFELVTGDAGLTASENAALVILLSKQYLLGLKGNQPKLFEYARTAFENQRSSPRAVTVERSHGATIRRELWCHSVNGPGQPSIDFPGARQFLCVRQTTEKEGKSPVVEWRYFITSLLSTRLSYQHFLALVRLHWRIENALNWTLDVILHEDDGAPCETSREALEVAAWLRALAYNSVSAFRAKAPLKDRLPISWARAMETLRDLFIHWTGRSIQTEELSATSA